MNSQTFKVKGMHCASCASNIERTLGKSDGVKSALANYGTESVKVDFDETKISPEKMSEKIKPLGYSLILENEATVPENHHHDLKAHELYLLKNKIRLALPLAGLSVFLMIWEIFSKNYQVLPMMSDSVSQIVNIIMALAATAVLVYSGRDYLLGIWRFIRYGKANMDTLIGIGTLTAYSYSMIVTIFSSSLSKFIDVDQKYFDVTIVVIGLITLGKYLEARSKSQTGAAIAKLLSLGAKTALVLRNSKEVEIPVEEVKHGDLIIVKPGGKIPVDGAITEGSSNIDESMVTGEPMPALKKIGDKVVAGTINGRGSFTFKATGVGSETMLAQIIKIVEEAQNSKAPIQKLADQISAVFVPIVLVISAVTLIAWLVIGSGSLGFDKALSFGLVSFVGVLVIACPCALGLATPTAIIVGVGKGAANGILIKNAEVLERVHKINTLIVDKTGTITIGHPEFIKLENFSKKTDNEFLQILASLEQKSEHPIAEAILNYATKKSIDLKKVEKFENIEGQGIKGRIHDVEYLAGNTKLIKNSKFKIQNNFQGTPIILATKDEVLGVIEVGDKVKPESKSAIAELHRLGIKVIMATGDQRQAAENIAKLAGIDQIEAEVLPKDKRDLVIKLQKEGRVVAMAGDGINDAPALAQADVGIAMGTGTDIAIESADLTLLHGDISKISQSIKLSRLTLKTIKQNLFWAFAYNIIGIPLAAGLFYPITGWLLSPIFAGAAMALSSVSVVTNSLRLKNKKI
ncbi:MAG: ATPase, E1-E2 type:Copper-translocating P-type ATPase:Heavy metal translocating P-type ATPase [Berkelbacteria bacterium GW2011_GWA2_38_9]|uniref:ATPase, E1-E2 type:Copper-translocating P-type ATPase:Heavy metal translocating P-type ATPase n=1 Tax=Berkelbacteria bacterium GW2011_GWA2_38_9 TaxID=1618334 RepID=A0A0G0L5R3_9BACT|nr:MAG: ATPase, E1-E2 type:Copper-translocating P-type ATPase:Heavy metal translocating P-type ATPase [Berkelbacteria bacterium GW2011_GWA2_38_9]